MNSCCQEHTKTSSAEQVTSQTTTSNFLQDTSYEAFQEDRSHPSTELYSGPVAYSTGVSPSQTASSAPQDPAQPIITITSPEPHTPRQSHRSASFPREGRPLDTRQSGRQTSSQPPNRGSYRQSRSATRQAHSAMSSTGSSPGNTGSSGTGSGSGNPGYHLPYAPFPYPMPNGGNSQGGQQGKGK